MHQRCLDVIDAHGMHTKWYKGLINSIDSIDSIDSISLNIKSGG